MQQRHFAWFVFSSLFLVGCQGEEPIREYKVEHKDRQDLRLIDAMVFVGPERWFFHLFGPNNAVEAQKKNFEAFLHSVKVEDGDAGKVKWSAPADWKEQKGDGNILMASFYIPGTDNLDPIELKISRAAGTLVDNLNRWRGKVNLPPIEEVDTLQHLKRTNYTHHEFQVVDMRGVGEFQRAVPRRAPPKMDLAREGGGLPFEYKAPAAWKQQNPPAPLSVASFRTAGDVAITLTPLGGGGGGILANVKRWRDQVGLPAVPEAELENSLQKVKVAGLGNDVAVVDVGNPNKNKRIVGAIFTHDETMWFVKMSGTFDSVGQAKADFDGFVQSMRLKK